MDILNHVLPPPDSKFGRGYAKRTPADPNTIQQLNTLQIAREPGVEFAGANADPIVLDTIEQHLSEASGPTHEVRFVKGVVEARDPLERPDVEERRQRLLSEFADTVFSGKITGDPPIRGPHEEAEIIL